MAGAAFLAALQRDGSSKQPFPVKPSEGSSLSCNRIEEAAFTAALQREGSSTTRSKEAAFPAALQNEENSKPSHGSSKPFHGSSKPLSRIENLHSTLSSLLCTEEVRIRYLFIKEQNLKKIIWPGQILFLLLCNSSGFSYLSVCLYVALSAYKCLPFCPSCHWKLFLDRVSGLFKGNK